MRFNIRAKLLTGFAVICAIIVVAGTLSIEQSDRLHSASNQMSRLDYPLIDAILEAEYWIADAHLNLEEILSGDTSESITDVMEKISLAQKYCRVILEGGRLGGVDFIEADSQLIHNQVLSIEKYIDRFDQLARQRYKHYTSFTVLSGSDFDQEFDSRYRSILSAFDSISRSHPDLTTSFTEMKFLLADNHLTLEEFSNGDTSVPAEKILKEYESIQKRISKLISHDDHPHADLLRQWLTDYSAKIISRIDHRLSFSGAGSQIEADFDLNYDQLIAELEKAEWLIKKNLAESLVVIDQTHAGSRNIILAATFLCLFMSIVIGLFLARNISVPIARLTEGLKKMARGNLNEEIIIPRSDEIGDISISFMEVIHSMREAANLADQVSRGDYEVTIIPKSDNDRLGLALKNMTEKLKDVSQINEEQFWVAETHAGLIEVIRGELNIQAMTANIASYLAEKLQAQIISFYLTDESGRLKLSGGYAIDTTNCITEFIEPGQGLVGQAAAGKQLIQFKDIPADYIRISSSLGDSRPQNITVLPLLHENVVKGVIEIGCTKVFEGPTLQLLNNITESIAIAVHGAQVHGRINQLLTESQSQTEELQSQQEELQAANEELEEKTAELIKSEEKLQTQQEELQVTNEELEARSVLLEKQKANMEQQRNEIALKARELETASKYKSEFLANMSHELRTPLNSILILSQLLGKNQEGNLTQKQLEFAKTINTSGSDLLELINEVLDLSKVESGKMQLSAAPIDLEDFLIDLKHTFEPVAKGKKLSLRLEISPKAPKQFISDPQRLRQIVKNLLSNAIKFTEKGSVSLLIDRPESDEIFQQKKLRHHETIAIRVIDTGIGIAADKRDLIFEAFQQEDGTTSRKYGGTGLGLSIARELAFFLGGEIKLESQSGQGSTFTLFLPTKMNQKTASPPLSMTEPTQSPGKKAKILPAKKDPPPPPGIADDRKKITPEDRVLLLVEDDVNFVKVLMDLAHQRDFKCIVAEDGESGLHCADFYQPNAIILDIGLPRMDGWTVMDRLKESPYTRHIPVHFISATDQPHDGLMKGAIGFLTKPVTEDSVQKALQRIEQVISRGVKNLLIVEDDAAQRNSIVELIGNGDVVTTAVATGKEALELIKSLSFDCMILDLGLSDMSGFELLEIVKADKNIPKLPIIIYTGRDLTPDEEDELNGFAESIIIKGVKSPERLLAETTLFLHRVEAELPDEKQRLLSNVQNREALFNDRKILIVDDDMRNVFALTSVLQEKGMKVLAGKTGHEALEILESNPDIDIVLMDVMMPEMDGFEAMRRIRADTAFNKLPIIALTAKAMKGDRNKCIEAGANDYLAKPVEIESLFSLLRVWLYK